MTYFFIIPLPGPHCYSRLWEETEVPGSSCGCDHAEHRWASQESRQREYPGAAWYDIVWSWPEPQIRCIKLTSIHTTNWRFFFSPYWMQLCPNLFGQNLNRFLSNWEKNMLLKVNFIRKNRCFCSHKRLPRTILTD